jgi:hypothetical protein
MAKTRNFSLEKFGAEGRISDNNYKFSSRDRDTIDALFHTLMNHDHRNVGVVSALAGPTQPPVPTVSTTGGTISSGRTFYYKISFSDSSGNETEASTAVAVSTPDAIVSPATPSISTLTTGGSLVSGVYRYALSYYQDAGGETFATNIASVIVPAGTSTNTITIGLDTPPADADGWKVYRKAPTEDEYYYLTSIAAGGTPPTTWTDTGSVSPDCTKKRPVVNNTNSSNSITIDIAAADLPLDARAVNWKLYRSSTAGVFGSSSLRATVSETTTESGTDLVTSYTDTGGTTFTGSPLSESVVPIPVPQLDASDIFDASSGRLPAALAPLGTHQHNTFCAGTLTDKTYNQFVPPFDMPLERIDAYYQTAPTGVDGSNYVTLRVSDNASQNEIQAVWNNSVEYNEVQSVYNNATGGTFTLSDGIDTTTAIAYDASSSTIKTRLETDIAAITTVNVSGTGVASNPWVIEFVNPGSSNFATLIAGDGSLTGGSSTVTVLTNGSDGGTFTLSDGTDTTTAIAFDAAAATVETRLETDITSITAVTVTGTGTEIDPWLIEFVTPGGQAVDLLEVDDANLNGTGYIYQDTAGYGSTQVDLDMTTTANAHAWQSTTTDYGEQEAESAPATGGTSVSDAFATNDVAMELDTQAETNTWTVGNLNAGTYTARFFAADSDGTATYQIRVVNTTGPTTVASLNVSDGSSYIPAKELTFTDTGGTENWRFEIEKTDAGAGVVRIDKYEYEAVLPTLHGGSTVTVEAVVTGTPTTNGDDLAVTLWY